MSRNLGRTVGLILIALFRGLPLPGIFVNHPELDIPGMSFKQDMKHCSKDFIFSIGSTPGVISVTWSCQSPVIFGASTVERVEGQAAMGSIVFVLSSVPDELCEIMSAPWFAVRLYSSPMPFVVDDSLWALSINY